MTIWKLSCADSGSPRFASSLLHEQAIRYGVEEGVTQIHEVHLPQHVPDAVEDAMSQLPRPESKETSENREVSHDSHLNESDYFRREVSPDYTESSATLSPPSSPRNTTSFRSRISSGSQRIKSMRSHASRLRSGPRKFTAEKADLVDNACAGALQKKKTEGDFVTRIDMEIERTVSLKVMATIDWSSAHNVQFLQNLCKFVRRLFWAFTDAHAAIHGSAPVVSRACKRAAMLFKSNAVDFFYGLLTVYALLGPDILAICGHTAAYNVPVAVVNTATVFLFFLEAALNSWVTIGYFCSGNFWVDIFATCTLIGDTWIAMELAQSDATMAARGTRVAKLVRVGGRSSRFVRLVRAARAVQALRFISKMQGWSEKGTHELALTLLHKRLWHLFNFLDRCNGYLSESAHEFLLTALQVQFPCTSDEARGGAPIMPEVWGKLAQVSESIMMTTTSARHVMSNMVSFSSREDAKKEEQRHDFPNVVNGIMSMPIGKRIFQQCVNDVRCMKESSSLLDKAVAQITLKVCILVLSLVIAIPLLESNVKDRSPDQVLASLDQTLLGLTTDLNGQQVVDTTTLCELAKPAVNWVERSVLKFMVLHYRIYWDASTGCECCLDHPASPLLNADQIYDLVDEWVKQHDLEPSMLTLHCLPDESCGDDVRSIALFSREDDMKYIARMSLCYTGVVVFVMVVLVLFFATELKRLSNKSLFHPLWDLLDDMCALKCMEVVSGGKHDQGTRSMDIVTKGNEHHLKRSAERSSAAEKAVASETAELTQLRTSFLQLRGAILSWGKYVPTILLNQLYEANIEATIGCTCTDVTILFCDIRNFEDLCRGKLPQDVLVILGTVLERITKIIEEKNGVLLEFIGDEVMACFNAPIQVQDHAKMALTAASEILEVASGISFGPVVQCGIHRAWVLAGNLGSPTRIKYGLVGDGVNMTARLKSLNTRYGTQLLVSSDALAFEGATQYFVTRPIGNLILKGKTSPTSVFEVFGKRQHVHDRYVLGAAKHTTAFDLFKIKQFEEARKLLIEAHDLLALPDVGDSAGDRPSQHLQSLCDQYIQTSPPEGFDGSEHLTQKAWT